MYENKTLSVPVLTVMLYWCGL